MRFTSLQSMMCLLPSAFRCLYLLHVSSVLIIRDNRAWKRNLAPDGTGKLLGFYL